MMHPLPSRPLFFVGIGGSGMLPLALIARGMGATVAGSDRSRDQGRTPEKFAWLAAQGFALFPQDGSGITSPEQVLVASAAVEDSVPEIVQGKKLGCERLSRAQLLAALFNASPLGIAVGGTSGKSTTTAMLGWILAACGRAPTIMNGAVMHNFQTAEAPFASAVVGDGASFVAEVDESDGSIALYRPQVAILLNISLDHKGLEELRVLFGDYLASAARGVVNADDAEAFALVARANEPLTFGLANRCAALGVAPGSITEDEGGQDALVIDRRDGSQHPLRLTMPGRHNLANALGAIAGASAAGVEVADAVRALADFAGLARRFAVVGTSASGITVIDDFAHNPDKCRATLRTLKARPGRVLAFFQPHGYGPLRQMGEELAATFAAELGPEDHTILCDPVYFGGTVDRSQGSARIARLIEEAGRSAEHIGRREDCADRLVRLARPGDRIVVMGARDDTLSDFARALLAGL